MRPLAPLSLALAASLGMACVPAPAPPAEAGLDATLEAGLDATTLDAAEASCEALFGLPNAHTGLTLAQCRPSCGCGPTAWSAPTFDAARVATLRSYRLLDTLSELTADPYAGPAPMPVPEGSVCAVVVVDRAARTYRLQNFSSEAAALAAGAYVTHAGICGLCSTLTDFAVYAERPDLTEPVRSCGLQTATQGLEADVQCLQALGFTRPCAQIWAYNTAHTRAECADLCFALLTAPYNQRDGALNECLACDETRSGDVFKAVAGRSRRNSGVASAICRPCSEAVRIPHDYP